MVAAAAQPGLGARPADEPWSTNRQLTLNPNGVPHAMPAIGAGGADGFAAWFDCSTFLRQAPGCLPFIGFAQWTGAGATAALESASDNYVARKAYPSIAVDGAGTAYAIWLDGREFSGQPQNADKADVFFSSRPSGGTWSQNVRVNPTAGSVHWEEVDVAVDERGNAAAVWVDGGAGQSDVFFSYRPTGGSWSAAVPVDESAPSGPRIQPAVAMDDAGNNYVVWIENGGLKFATRAFGRPWDPSIRLDDANWIVRDPDVTVDPAGNVHVVWTGGRSLPFATTLFNRSRPAGEAWQAAAWLDADAAGYVPARTGAAIGTNADGDVYLAWLQIDPVQGLYLPTGDVRFAFRPAGGSWGASERVTDRCCGAFGTVGLAVDDEGGAHAVWTDERNLRTDPEGYRQDIYSASRDRPLVEADRLKLQGQVFGSPDASQSYPVIGAPVALLRGQRVIRRTVSLPPDGRYVLENVPKEDGLVISTTLTYAATSPPTFRVMYGRTSPPVPVHLRTFPMQLKDAESDVTRNLVFTDSSNFDIDARIRADDLGSLAVVYFHTRQAALLAEALGQQLDLKLPLDVVPFSVETGVFWRGPVTLYPSTASRDPFINIEAVSSASYYMDGDRPTNREWHEFGHSVMGDAFTDFMPWAPDTTNHAGYKNSHSTDSWVEGFAEFYSLLVGQEIARAPRPMYTVSGTPLDMETNYLAWRNEEFAVAGLLWDLQDPADARDTTRLGGQSYPDMIAVDYRALWEVLTRDWGSTVGHSPAAPADYGHIFDVKQLYDVLIEVDIGATVLPGRELSELEALFIAHGLFADVNDNARYDPDEQIGRVASKQQPNRRKAPEISGSFIAADAVDAATGATVPIRDFTVAWCFGPDNEYRDYAWQQRLDPETGRLYFFGPDPQYDATAFVVANADGYRPSEPFGVQNIDYWRLMADNPADAFLAHTFRLQRGGAVYLPAVSNRQNAALTTMAGPPPGAAAMLSRQSTKRSRVFAAEPYGAMRLLDVNALAICGNGGLPTATPDPRTPATPTATRMPTRVATPTITPDPDVSPTPSATPPTTGPAQRVARANTTDPGNLTRTAFVAGDRIWLWALLENDQQQPVETDVSFTVTAESGAVAEDLTWSGRLSLPPGATWFRIERSVDAAVPTGLYYLGVTVTVGDASTSQRSALYIGSSLLRADDFADASSGWPVVSYPDSEGGYAGGEYRIAVHTAGKTLWATDGTRAEDVVLEGDVRVATSIGAGALVFGLTDDGGDLTIFGIDGDGNYGLYRDAGTGWRALVPWSASPVVPPRGTSGHLMLVQRADRVRLFISGVEMTEPAAESIPAGRLGWYAEARQPGLEARFDNFRAYAP